jgi:hypothetical protein
MNDHGYTLTEALTALLMLGLALGGVTQAVHVMSGGSVRLERERERLEGLAQARSLLRGLPDNLGPFVAGADRQRPWLSGSETSMRFICGYREFCAIDLQPAPGGVKLDVTTNGHLRSVRLRSVDGPRLQYVSAVDGVVSSTWPLRIGDRLGAVELEDRRSTLAVLLIDNVQDAACAFDLVSGGCVRPNGAANVQP